LRADLSEIDDVDSGDDPNQAGATHEGTFVISEESDKPAWTPDGDSIELGCKVAAAAKSDTDWGDVNDQSHDFLAVEEAASDEDQPEEPVGLSGETVGSPADVTASIDGKADDGSDVEDDDSIEAYMNRLLRRVQGDDDTPDAEMPETISASTSVSMSNSTSKATEVDDVMTTLSEPIDTDAPLVPRSQAPERSGSLSAMRDLAKISHSDRVQSRDTQIQAMISFACAAGALACNLFAFFFLKGILLILAVAMTFIVALCCIREGMHLMEEARRRMKVVDSDDEPEAVDSTDEPEAVIEATLVESLNDSP